jgi:hypothetical protein
MPVNDDLGSATERNEPDQRQGWYAWGVLDVAAESFGAANFEKDRTCTMMNSGGS